MDYHYLFADVDHLRYLKHDGKHIFLCHYPLAEWSGYYRGSLHIYGHIHNQKESAVFDYMKNQERALNAGVDICQYMPVTLGELIAYNDAFKKLFV
jgi:calcineurin-like phosphoesterase family protein